MPIYEYRCQNCGSVVEELRTTSTRDEPAQCPKCHSKSERIVSCCAPTPGVTQATSSSSCGTGGFS